MTNLTLCCTQKEDIAVIKSISDAEFGERYFTEKEFRSFLFYLNHLLQTVKYRGQIVGFVLCKWLPAPKIKRYGLDQLFDENTGQIGIIKSIAFSKAFQNKGFGSQIFPNVLGILRQKGIQEILTIAWKHNDSIPLEKILRKNDFDTIQEIPDYWFHDSLLKGYTCPVCGAPPCHCPAMLYGYGIRYEKLNRYKRSLTLSV